MTRLPKSLLIAIGLAAAFLYWSFSSFRTERDALDDDAVNLIECRQMVAEINRVPAIATSRLAASRDYQPEHDVVRAAASAEIEVGPSFSISHGAPQPIAGTEVATVAVQMSQLELSMRQIFTFIAALEDAPVPMNVRQIQLSRPTNRKRNPAAGADEEVWIAGFDIYYLVPAQPTDSQ